MFKSFFGAKKKPEISIFPEKASASISSLALLLVTIGSPFSEWKPSDVPLTAEEELTVRPACHCYQLYSYHTHFDDMKLGEVLLGCAMAVAKEQREGLMELMNMGYSVIAETFYTGVAEFGNEPEGIRKSISTVAIVLTKVFGPRAVPLTETEMLVLAEKVEKCLYHARDRANIIFEPMVRALKDFDLDGISQLNFNKNEISLFERVLQNREEFGFLYPGFDAPTAYAQYLAKAKAAQVAESLEARHEAAINTMAEKLKAAEGENDGEAMFDAITQWFFASEDILAELRGVSGRQCKNGILVLTKRQASILDHVKPMLFTLLGPGANPDQTFAELKQSCDNVNMNGKLKAAMSHLPSDEILSFLFTLNLEDFASLKKRGIEKHALEIFIESIGGLPSMTHEQREYVSERLALA